MSNPYDYYDFEDILSYKKLNKNKREPYIFTVTATNSVGSSVSSSTSKDTLPITVPNSPIITKLENVSILNGQQCNVYFNSSSDNGGSTITNYIVSTDNNITASGTTSPINVTGLTNGKSYTFSIYSVNSVGKSPLYTYPTQFIPSTIPKNVTNLSSVFSNNKINIKFTPSSDNGGSPITNYNIQYGLTTIGTTNTINIDTSGNLTSIDANTFKLTDMSKDTSGNISFNLSPTTSWTYGLNYTIYITTCNSNGCSDIISTTVTPGSVPNSPGNLTTTSSNNGINLSFNVPPNNGSNIQKYTLRPYYTTVDSSGNKSIKCDTSVTITDPTILNAISGSTGNYTFSTTDRTKTFDTTSFPPTTTTFPNCSTESYSYVPLKKKKKSNCYWFVFLLFIICFFILFYRNKNKTFL